jgi:hypothetical protein
VQLGHAVMQEKQAAERDRRQILRDVLEHRSVDASKAFLHGCDQQTVKDSILAFRRGPIRYRHNPAKATLPITCTWSSAAWFEVVGTIGTVAAASSLFTCPESFLDGAADQSIHSLWKPQQIHSCFFSNAALCLPPPFETAQLQRICWPLQRMSFDAPKTIHFC